MLLDPKQTSSLDVLLSRLQGQLLTLDLIEAIREVVVRQTREAVATAVSTAIKNERDEKEELRHQISRLAEAYELEVRIDETGALKKKYFEQSILPTYVKLLCTTQRGLDRRSMWPVLHFVDGRSFGVYNKFFNQIVGDQIISMFSRILRRTVRTLDALGRQYDFVAHVGGDEFAILQTDVEVFYEAFDTPRRFIEAVRDAEWDEVKEVLKQDPPMFDIGSVCLREQSLRGLRDDTGELYQHIAAKWYELGTVAMKAAKEEAKALLSVTQASGSIIRIVQWDEATSNFVDVPENDIPPRKLEHRHLEP